MRSLCPCRHTLLLCWRHSLYHNIFPWGGGGGGGIIEIEEDREREEERD